MFPVNKPCLNGIKQYISSDILTMITRIHIYSFVCPLIERSHAFVFFLDIHGITCRNRSHKPRYRTLLFLIQKKMKVIWHQCKSLDLNFTLKLSECFANNPPIRPVIIFREKYFFSIHASVINMIFGLSNVFFYYFGTWHFLRIAGENNNIPTVGNDSGGTSCREESTRVDSSRGDERPESFLQGYKKSAQRRLFCRDSVPQFCSVLHRISNGAETFLLLKELRATYKQHAD